MMKHASTSKDAQVRREHYAKIRVELLSHERAELAELYPHLAHLESTRELVARRDREATQLESAIRNRCPGSQQRRLGLGIRLLVPVEQHIAQEEGELFPKAQAAIGDAAAEALRTRYEAAKISAQKQLA